MIIYALIVIAMKDMALANSRLPAGAVAVRFLDWPRLHFSINAIFTIRFAIMPIITSIIEL